MVPLTRRLRFLVAVRPGLQEPAVAARMAATLDRISDGRLLIETEWPHLVLRRQRRENFRMVLAQGPTDDEIGELAKRVLELETQLRQEREAHAETKSAHDAAAEERDGYIRDLNRLQTQLRQEEKAHLQTIDERDAAEEEPRPH